MSKFKAGDKIRKIAGGSPFAPTGFQTTVSRGNAGPGLVNFRAKTGNDVCGCEEDWELITPPGPVVTETVKRIKPGTYGILEIIGETLPGMCAITVGPHMMTTPDNLRAAAATLIEIADALSESTKGNDHV